MANSSPAVSYKIGPDLLIPPHVVSELIEMVENGKVYSETQQEQLLQHLLTCLPCQAALGVLAIAERGYHRPEEHSEEPVGLLLAELTRLMHATRAQEDMSAYIEMLSSEGEKKAQEHFPLLAEHIKQCQFCQDDIKETLSWLKKAEKQRIIPRRDAFS